MTFKPAGYFNFKMKDNSEIVGATASITLCNWYILSTLKRPESVPSDSSLFEVVEIKRPYPHPYHPNFLVSIIGYIERTFGSSPADLESYDSDWYKRLPDSLSDSLSSFRVVDQAYRRGNPQVVSYEQSCLKILKWLEKRGEIAEVPIFSDELQ